MPELAAPNSTVQLQTVSPAAKEAATMILEHYSKQPLGEVRPAVQSALPDHKPQGLWLSVRGARDWPEWCRDERWNLSALKHCATFQLAAGANVLHLTTPAEIDTFHVEHSVAHNPAMPSYREIAWAQVAKQYDGIIIAPYSYARRLDRRTIWYYGWDCASAAIWHPRAIERIDQ